MPLLQTHTRYTDGMPISPRAFPLQGGRIIDLSGLTDDRQVAALSKVELAGVPPDEPVVIILTF